ncbi:DNA repair and recombination protein RadB [Candidatus Woesearchaeota archaeon CG_4_10_14_0_8_um_filter_47_5]|nr:MAG: DNA repair and recombination protein RadB [Candidatus Woesearchaeota archaeon CG_4_10_14_0_8_um_filter_47_5]
MSMRVVPTGVDVFDVLLGGGYSAGITTFYGPRGVGKTTVCIMSAQAVLAAGKKVIYISTENISPVVRMTQIDEGNKKLLSHLLFFTPETFEEQTAICEKLRRTTERSIGMVIVDSIAPLYRLRRAEQPDIEGAIRELGRQMAYLTDLSRKMEIPILITTQVYADIEKQDAIKMVGGEILHYGSTCLIELQKRAHNLRRAILEKHPSVPQGNSVVFTLCEKGIVSRTGKE